MATGDPDPTRLSAPHSNRSLHTATGRQVTLKSRDGQFEAETSMSPIAISLGELCFTVMDDRLAPDRMHP